MNFFKRLWLNSEERKELNKLRKLKTDYEKVTEDVEEPILSSVPQESAYKNYFLVNGILTVVFNNGNVVSKGGAILEDVEAIKKCKTSDEVLRILYPAAPITVEEKEEKIDASNLSILKDDERFIVEGNKVYMKDINLEIPHIIVESFIEILEKMNVVATNIFLREADVEDMDELKESFEALKYFWMWTALNPIESSRNDLLTFIKKNDVKITSNGLLVLYRRANLVKNHNPLIDFISIQYFKYKHWKKSPKNYEIVENVDNKELKVVESGKLPDIENTWEYKGNLQELYLDLPNMQKNYLTDAHTGKLEITVGGIYSIPEENVDISSRNTCSRGLHVAVRDYDYSGFGNTPLLCLVNPSKVRSVPIGEEGKMRVSEMYIASILEIDEEGKYMDEDIDIVNFDQEYFNYTVQDLEEDLKNKSFESLVCQDTIVPIPLQSVINIIDVLKNRVVLM